MNSAPEQQRGLALGAWGAVQASAVGLAVALGGVVRDFIAGANVPSLISGKPVATGYLVVYGIEIALLCITTVAMMPLLSRVRGRRAVAA
jgi:BCD family chlorophyll transporter-like MFS transporter